MSKYTVAGRELREGDEVRLLRGPRAGRLGMVVGFDVFGGDRVVVQFPKAIDGSLREAAKADELQLFREAPAPEALEPLPDVRRVIQEGKFDPIMMTCGLMVCFTLTEDGTVLTCVPRHNSVRLRRIFEGRYKKSFREAVEEVIRLSFVTRLPHLVQIGNSETIGAYLSAPVQPQVKVGMLLGSPLNG